jgi:hypothetical protein
LEVGGNRFDGDIFIDNVLSKVMVLDVYVFRPGAHLCYRCNLNGSAVVLEYIAVHSWLIRLNLMAILLKFLE